jgi:hypothetical protein
VQRTINGRRYDVSLRRSTATAALEELVRFEKDPANYQPALPKRVGVYLEKTMVEDFLAWSRDVKRNSEEWRREQRRVLSWWGEKLAGVDLRDVTVRDHIRPALEGVPAAAKAQRIRVLKSFYGWCCENETLDRNPLFRRMRDETKIRPAQWKRSKVIPIADAAAVYHRLTTPYRDALVVLFATGWHARELVRFAKSGSIEPVPEGREVEGAAVLVTPRTKAGNPLRTIVADAGASAARRLRERGDLSGQYVRRAFEKACKEAFETACNEAGVPITERMFQPGRARHTVATYAKEKGTPPDLSMAFLNHGTRTTDRFYATHAIPKKIPTPEVELLRHALLKVVPA